MQQNQTPPNSEETLEGGGRTHVTRGGDIVYREAQPWTPSVHALLEHLHAEGFEEAPRIAGTGFDESGRETLIYVEGEFVHPGPWSDEALNEVGKMVRRLHDTTAEFDPPEDAAWQPWFLRDIGAISGFGHGDLAPWNTLTREGRPIALIDWEYAGPIDPLVELARVCWLFPQLHDDEVAERVGLPPLDARARQLRILVDGYELNQKQRSRLFDLIVEVTVQETAHNAIEAKITPTSEGPLWGLAWRARAAAWMLRNRTVLENALT